MESSSIRNQALLAWAQKIALRTIARVRCSAAELYLRNFHKRVVTSDLDPETRKAEDCQGESGRCTRCKRSRKCFVLKILTPNSLGLKILRSAFVKPAPGARFRDGRGRGVPSNDPDSGNGTDPNCPSNPF